MPEVTLTRSRSSSQGSDAQRNAIKMPVPPPDSAAVGEPDRMTISSSEEQNGVKNMSKKRRPHPAQLKKSVLLSIANGTENDGGTKSPRHGSMLRRFSRAASFKKAREHLPVNIDLKGILHRFERHSTIHGICHASLAPNKRWRRFWLSVFALCLIILIIQVIYTAIKFLKYPKTVDLDLKFENAPFPSVTICNLNPYKASAIRNDIAAKATMDALENVLQETGRSEGVAAAISTDNVKKARRELKRHQLNRREKKGEEEKQQKKPSSSSPTAGTDWREMALAIHRRYLQVYATCYCEVSRLSSVRKQGSCYAAYKNRVTVRFLDNTNSNNGSDQQQQHMHYFYPTKCLCQLDWMAKAIWPCFPYNTWKEHICVECVDDHGHCPMRFLDYRTTNGEGNNGGGYRKSRQSAASSSHRTYAIEMLDENMDICVCHREYNHCVANNLDGEIPEIMPGDDLNLLNISHLTEGVRRRGEVSQAVVLALKTYETSKSSTNDTEEQQIIEQAMGFEELHDEIAIKGQARENLIFAVEEKPLDERVRLSQAKDELILKCSFNQHDCDIEKDFKLFHDPTYGNCYTFNWDRNAQVTAHRAGANYGLRVLVYANVSEYLPITEAVGFRITVHDKWTVPFVDAFGYNAPTGTLSAFGVRMKKFFRLEHPYGHCREGGERAEWYIYNKKENYNYSIEGCHRSCTQREVVRVCGCADPMFPVPQGAVQCRMSDPVARNCLKNTTRQLSQLIADGALEECQCPLPCYETGYEVTYSAANWPSGTTKLLECESNDALCMEKYRINAAMIQVFYEELNYQTLTESPAYSMTSLIADLGGLSGLWIGISVVSILEVVQLIWFCMQYIHKKKTPELLAMVRSARQRSSAGHTDKSPSGSSSSPPRARTESVGAYSLKSLHSVRSDLRPGIRITQERRPSHSTGSSTPYLAPEVELPCTCLYGARGQIVFMKPLCPFHGYMVRRIMRPHSDEEEEDEIFDEEGDEEEEEEAEDDAGGDHPQRRLLNPEEIKALEHEADMEHGQADGGAATVPHDNGKPRPSVPSSGATRRASARRGTVKSSRRSSSSSSTEARLEAERKRTLGEM